MYSVTTTLAVYSILGIASVFLLWTVYTLYFHPLSCIPGPRFWAISRIPYVWTLRQGRYAIRAKELHAQYGSVVRVASNEVSVIDQSAWATIYTNQHGSLFQKSPYWFQPRPNGSYGIMACPTAEHSRFRKNFAPAFTEKAVREQEPLILGHIDVLLKQVSREASQEYKRPVNIIQWLEYTNFDIIGDFTFSAPFQCLERGENRGHIDVLQSGMKAFTYAVIPRTLGLEALWQLIVPKISSDDRLAYWKSLTYWTHKRLDEADSSDKNDLVTFASHHVAKKGENEKGLSIIEIENALGDMMIAGSETVTTTLAAVLYGTLKNPRLHQQLVDEIRRSFQHEADITVGCVAKLALLDACISEAMRLCPSLPMVLPRIVPNSGSYIGGYRLSPGTHVSFCQLAAYQSPTNFASPMAFMPERWLPKSTMRPHNADVFQPFSVGPRGCIGKQFGLAVVRLTLARLLWNFDLSAAEKDWDWNAQKAFYIWYKRPLYVNVNQVR